MSIAIAFDRLQSASIIPISKISKDINEEFFFIKESDLIKAIKNGALGKYGITYRLSTQIFCIWIRRYLKEANIYSHDTHFYDKKSNTIKTKLST